ncbi:predicted protein [Sclerotinia sclerotiorum 1980 UF-70]|uniref:Uncharacterized protein n=2 Tax=Sclerotinia sclerotiorum (strain ATCC 18683 / 1980 / Ss-1) TaxID=665079 RepID=A7EJB5_SCLS1|nr:predicted protein [Sclerotinia sclerotiorum 1980 UF-70]APA11884.1 hypothetical protein sscle_08g066540 [Sclerotinia sclerotiorum 1980 UF-70]EDO02931.1 predicted protein [Sclerotinia sclerotiorum 1980 UF-70]
MGGAMYEEWEEPCTKNIGGLHVHYAQQDVRSTPASDAQTSVVNREGIRSQRFFVTRSGGNAEDLGNAENAEMVNHWG